MAEKNSSTSSPQAKNSVHKKLHAIMTRVDRIEKDATNKFHNYKYASEKIIKETLHAELVKEKVLFQLSAIDLITSVIKTAKGEDTNLTHIKFEYKFIDIETGDAMVGTFYGTGEDKGDKGTYQAITGAIKYILTSVLLIPTGDDPEKDKDPDNDKNKTGTKKKGTTGSKQEPGNGKSDNMMTAEQRKKIFALVNEKNLTASWVKFTLENKYNIDSTKRLSKKQASEFIDVLEKVPMDEDDGTGGTKDKAPAKDSEDSRNTDIPF